jgi:4-amino-4-deoxychorismate lyase
MYQLFESIKIKNGETFHLDLHQQRMNRAVQDLYHLDCAPCLKNVFTSNVIPDDGIYKCRIFYGNTIDGFEIQKYFPKKISSLKIIYNNTIEYAHKYANRDEISSLLMQKGNTDEIIISKEGLITDASYANLVFYDGSKWVTPAKPLLKGIQREYLLSKNKISISHIKIDDINKFEKVALINAMLDFDDKIEIPMRNVIVK